MVNEIQSKEYWDSIREKCEECEKILDWKEMRIRECEEWGSDLDYTEAKNKIVEWRERVASDKKDSEDNVMLGDKSMYRSIITYYNKWIHQHTDRTGVSNMSKDERKRLFMEWRDYKPVNSYGMDVDRLMSNETSANEDI